MAKRKDWTKGPKKDAGKDYEQVNSRGAVATPSGETVIGLRTPTGKPKGSTFESDPKATADAQAARKAWERSEEGKDRLMDMSDLTGGQMTPGQYHFHRNFDRRSIGPRHWDVQLPGMADPSAAPRPPRWEELSDDQQKVALAALAQIGGTDLKKMISDIGSQYDQGIYRADLAGASSAHGEKFYSTGEPRIRLRQSAHELGIPETVHAQMNAMTSPNTKFFDRRGQGRPDAGEIYFPNDDAAVHAVKWVQQGNPAASLTNDLGLTGVDPHGSRAQGYEVNIRKAALSYEQFTQGVPPSNWVTGKGGKGPFESSPKTGPYANSWNDTHPQFLVSDVHTGGGGFLPHLSSEKPVMRDASGNPILDANGKEKRDKSEREKAIASIPFFHSMADYAARKAAAQRNIGSLREFQGGQWGEEQIRRGLESPEILYRQGGQYVPSSNSRTGKNYDPEFTEQGTLDI